MSAAADRGAGCTLYTCKLGIYRTWLYIVKYVYDYTTMAPAWHGLTCYCTSVPVVCRMRYMSMSVSFWNIRLDARILGEVAPVRGRVHSPSFQYVACVCRVRRFNVHQVGAPFITSQVVTRNVLRVLTRDQGDRESCRSPARFVARC